MSPAGVLCAVLAGARRDGATFETAWPTALEQALAVADTPWARSEWAKVLGELVAVWRSAFDRRPASERERALHVLIEREEGEPAVDRSCWHCGGELPEARASRVTSRYCSRECRLLAWKARKRARVGGGAPAPGAMPGPRPPAALALRPGAAIHC